MFIQIDYFLSVMQENKSGYFFKHNVERNTSPLNKKRLYLFAVDCIYTDILFNR